MRFLFSPYGRTNRKGLWLFVAIFIALSFGSVEADRLFGTYSTELSIGAVEAIIGIALLWPSIAVPVRRLHDLGYSGWWVLWVALISTALLIGAFVAAAFGGVDLEFLATLDENTSFLEMPRIVWAAIGLFALPYLIQYFMLGFLPGQEGENRFDLSANHKRVVANETTPPWSR